MLPLKRISWFFVCSVFVYALLVAPWHGLQDAYRTCFRAGGNLLFGTIGEHGSAKFAPLTSKRGTADTLVTLRKRGSRYGTGLNMSSAQVGYRPTVFLIALALATPIPWSRRWKALVLGLLAVQGFIAFRVWLFLADLLSNENDMAIYSLVPWMKSILSGVSLVLFRSPAMHYIGPLFIWLGVTFRRGDFETLMGRAPVDRPVKPASRRSKRRSKRRS